MPVRVGLTPTSRIVNGSRAPMQAATRKNAADEMSPGTLDLRALQRCGRVEADDAVAGADRAAEALQHALGVVARDGGLDDGGLALRIESRQQHGGLHLRAGHRHFVADAVQLRAAA